MQLTYGATHGGALDRRCGRLRIGACLGFAILAASAVVSSSPATTATTATAPSDAVAAPRLTTGSGAWTSSPITPTLVTLAPGGDGADGASSLAAVSSDGSRVAFQSEAENLTPGADLGLVNILARRIAGADRSEFVLGDSRLIGVVWDEPGTAFPSTASAVLTSDGQRIVFRSSVGERFGAPGPLGLFVHDLESGVTTTVDAAHDGAPPNGVSASPSISSDGRFIAFHSYADNLVTGDVNGLPDVFVHDLDSRATRLVSRRRVEAGAALVPATGIRRNSGDGASVRPWLAGRGGVIVFESDASDLVPVDGNGVRDVFAFDMEREEIRRISVGPGGAEAGRDSHSAVVSADGRFAAFVSDAGELSPSALAGASAVYLHDVERGLTSLASIPFDGGVWGLDPSDSADMPSISADGRFIAFRSTSRRLVPSALEPPPEVYVLDRIAAEWIGIRSTGADGDTEAPIMLTRGALGDGVIVFSTASPIEASDTNTVSDVYAARIPAEGPVARIVLPWLHDGTADLAQGIDFEAHSLAPLHPVRAHRAPAGDH